MIKTTMSYTDELRALARYTKRHADNDTPVEIRINLENLLRKEIGLEELGTQRCIEYEIIGFEGDVLIAGQGWSLDDAFKEAKQDFFDIMNDD